jgi:ABC-2 type transport system permease protein
VSALLAVEIRRILSRRAVFLAVALVLLGMLIAGGVLFARSHRLDPAQFRARQQHENLYRRQLLAECASGSLVAGPEGVPEGMTLEQYCQRIVGTPEIEDLGFRLIHFREIVEGLSGLFIALVMILAASFIGAEWHAGTITTQLTWEPRRNRVFGAKVVAAALFGFAFVLLAQAVLLGAVTPTAVFRGTTDGINAAWVRGAAGLVLRAAGAAGLVAAIAFSLASIARNTAAAVGGAFVYIAVLEPLIRAARPKWQPWYLYDNMATFISGHRLDFTSYPRSVTEAGLLISIYTLGFVLLALALFRQRDVT